MMVTTIAAGRSEEKSQGTFLSWPLRMVGGTLPKHITPTTLCAHEAVPALRIARQRPIDLQICARVVRVDSPAPDC